MPMGTLQFLDKYNARFRQIYLTFKTRFCLDYTNTRVAGNKGKRGCRHGLCGVNKLFENSRNLFGLLKSLRVLGIFNTL